MLGRRLVAQKKLLLQVKKKIKKYRRSIYSSKSIKRGEIFTTDNIKVIRPGNGLEPKYYDYIIGKKAKKKINLGQPINFQLINNSS